MPQRARAMDWGLRGVKVIDVDRCRRGDHALIDFARPFAHVPDGIIRYFDSACSEQ